MCLVHGGKFSMGGGAYAPDATPRNIAVEDFYIDQFEVSTQQAVLFLNAHGNSCPGVDKDERTGPYAHQCINSGFDAATKITSLDGIIERDGHFEVKPGFELKPEADFSFEGAMRYCEWVGKQVPSSAQWEYAARHDPVTATDLVFPWGDKWLPEHAACWGCIGSARPAQLPSIGMYDGTNGRADGSSPWGVHDMAGGASELVFDCADANTTCRTGEPCACRTYATFDDHRDVMALASSSRMRLEYVGDQGLRCLRPAK